MLSKLCFRDKTVPIAKLYCIFDQINALASIRDFFKYIFYLFIYYIIYNGAVIKVVLLKYMMTSNYADNII